MTEIETAEHFARLAEERLRHLQVPSPEQIAIAQVEASLAEAWARIAGAKQLQRSNELAEEAKRIGMAQGMAGGRA